MAYTIPPPHITFSLERQRHRKRCCCSFIRDCLLCASSLSDTALRPILLVRLSFFLGTPSFRFRRLRTRYARLVVCRRKGFRCHFQAAPVRCFLRQSGTISVAAYHLRLYAVACGDMQKPPRFSVAAVLRCIAVLPLQFCIAASPFTSKMRCRKKDCRAVR